jgi:hypothetical protein
MCKKFEFIVEKMSDEDANVLWDRIIEFVEDRGLYMGGVSMPCDIDTEEVTDG